MTNDVLHRLNFQASREEVELPPVHNELCTASNDSTHNECRLFFDNWQKKTKQWMPTWRMMFDEMTVSSAYMLRKLLAHKTSESTAKGIHIHNMDSTAYQQIGEVLFIYLFIFFNPTTRNRFFMPRHHTQILRWFGGLWPQRRKLQSIWNVPLTSVTKYVLCSWIWCRGKFSHNYVDIFVHYYAKTVLTTIDRKCRKSILIFLWTIVGHSCRQPHVIGPTVTLWQNHTSTQILMTLSINV